MVLGSNIIHLMRLFLYIAAKDASWTLDPVVYLNRLDADASLGVHVMAKVTQTKQTFVHQQSFEVDKPDLDVQVRAKRSHYNNNKAARLEKQLSSSLLNYSFF